MKSLKKFFALCLTLALALSLAACAQKPAETTDPAETPDTPAQETEAPVTARIAALKGPTAMGLVKLMKDNDELTAALLDTLEATLTQSAIRPPLTTPVARIATVDVTWNSGLLEKCWPGLSLLAFGHAGVGGAGVRDLLDRLERGMAEDRWPEQQAPFKQALADALTQRSSLDAALRANDPRAAHRASEALEDALTEMEDSLLAAGSGPKRKKPSFFRRLFGLR